MSGNKATLASKLVKVMSVVGRIKKDGYNSHHKYNYVSEAAVLEEMRKAFIDNNIFISQSVDSVQKEGDITTVIMTNTLIDSDTGESLIIKSVGQGKDNSDKGVYKAITGANKYFFLKNFMLPTGDDPEATDDVGKPTAKLTSNAAISKPTATLVTAPEKAAATPGAAEAPKKKVSFSKKAFESTVATSAASTSDDL